MKRGTFQLMKSVNKSIVLNKIRTSEPISRAQIAKETKLTPPTVSSIVRELMEQELVVESELGKSRGGRKPTMLSVNKNGYYVVGVDAGPNTIECILSNLSGQIKDRAVISIDPPLTNESFINLLKDSVNKIIQKVNNPDKILGIGIAMHGVVDSETGTSLVAPLLQLRDIPLKEVLERELDFEVKVENDARAMALGESWFGQYGRMSSMVTVNIGSGVGAGVIVDGKLYHGATDLAGEVGHMTIDLHGEVCECGNKGCLEAYASAPSIVKRANRKMPDKEIMSSEEIFQLAVNGDQECIDILEETGEILGIGLTNVIHVVNPELVILGGGVSNAQEFILPVIQKTIEERALTPRARETQVVVSNLGHDSTALGAVALFLVDLFNPA